MSCSVTDPMVPEDDIPCVPVAFNTGFFAETLAVDFILRCRFVLVLGVVIVIEDFMAPWPDRKSTTLRRHIVNITDSTEMKWMRVYVTPDLFFRDITVR